MIDILDVWRARPDPRLGPISPVAQFSVRVPVLQLVHVIDKHRGNPREPWRSCLPEELVAEIMELVQWRGKDLAARRTMQSLSQQLHLWCRQALERPLVQEEVRRTGDTRLRPRLRWILVLPPGALVVIDVQNDKGTLITAYYLKAAALETDPARRWRRAVATLVWCNFHPLDPGVGQLQLDESPEQLENPDDKMRHGVRFFTPAAWGFDTAGSSTVWRGKLNNWPAAEPIVSSALPPRHSLRKRWRRMEFDDE